MTASPTQPLVVGIDCGTQSAKVVIVDAAGRTIAQGRQALRPMIHPTPGAALHPDDDLWTATTAACRAAVAALSADAGTIVGVGLCPIRCCKAFLDADGHLVEPLMSWMDTRAYQPYLPAVENLRYATTSSGYLTYRFTGEFRDTVSNNVIQWPLDQERWDWSNEMGSDAVFGGPRSMLAELVLPGGVLGHLTSEAAAATGLPVGVPVVATGNDKAVEMLGAGSIDDTTALVSLGTYIAGMVHGERNHPDATAFWTNLAAIPHRYLYESTGIRRGMWTLTWFLDMLGPELADRAASMGLTREQYLEREAVLVPPGSDSLLTVLDWLATSDAPSRKGMFIGFDDRHGRAHIYRSILEAIAMTMHRHVDAMAKELGVALRSCSRAVERRATCSPRSSPMCSDCPSRAAQPEQASAQRCARLQEWDSIRTSRQQSPPCRRLGA
jgi:sugar (pentulose or hexulose) kinase